MGTRVERVPYLARDVKVVHGVGVDKGVYKRRSDEVVAGSASLHRCIHVSGGEGSLRSGLVLFKICLLRGFMPFLHVPGFSTHHRNIRAILYPSP